MEIVLPPEWNVELPADRPLDVDDYLRLPEGPPHFELIDGALIMNASPLPRHAYIATNLSFLLFSACPPHLVVYGQPVDWVADRHHVLEPDLSVAARSTIGNARLTDPPMLVVEVLSPSTRVRDLTVKRDIYDRGGVGAYWIVDPTDPRLLVHERDAATGRFGERTDHGPADVLVTDVPFPITVDVGGLAR